MNKKRKSDIRLPSEVAPKVNSKKAKLSCVTVYDSFLFSSIREENHE